MDLLPSSDEEIKAEYERLGLSFKQRQSLNGGSFKRGRKEEWLYGAEKEKFLNDSNWNDFEIDKDVLEDQTDRNQTKFEKLMKMLNKQQYDFVIDAYTLFIKNCIPKPFKSMSVQGNNRGWTVSCLASTFGENSISTLSVGKHIAANVSLIDKELYFSIYLKKEKLENIYGENMEKLVTKYPEVHFSPMEGTIKGKELNIYCVVFPIKEFNKEINNPDLILAIRDFITHLINASKTIWVKHQSQNLVNDIFKKIKK